MALKLKKEAKEAEDTKAQKQAEEQAKKEEVKKASKQTLSEVLAAVRKDKGDKVIVPASCIPVVKRLPTGNFEFDYYTGGGFPRGRITIVYGPESSWKTSIVLQAIRSAQQEPEPCNKAVYVNVEQRFDPDWAAKLGVDNDKLMIVNPGYGEEAVDLVDALVRADDLNLIAVDSTAALIASAEIAKSVEKADVGTSAMLVKRLVNKLMIAFCEEARKDHFPTVVFINQRRFKPGVIMGDPETMPGGEAQKFLSSLRIRVYGKNVFEGKAATQLLYKDVHAVIKKSSVPVRASSFNFKVCVHEGGDLQIGDTDSFNMVKGYLQAMGLLEKVPKGYTIFGVEDTCPFCKGAGVVPPANKTKCGACDGTGLTLKVYPTLTSIQDQYQQDFGFKMKLQGMVLSKSNDQLFLVDYTQEKGPAEVQPGQPVQSIAEEG